MHDKKVSSSFSFSLLCGGCCKSTGRHAASASEPFPLPRPHPPPRLTEVRHNRYLDQLQRPSWAEMATITHAQERKEQEQEHQEKQNVIKRTSDDREASAAQTLQRNYRGHRDRRHLNGLTLDPSTRWIEAVKEVQFRNLITPQPRRSLTIQEDGSHDPARISSRARDNWHRVSQIARRAGSDNDESSSTSASSNTSLSPSQRQARRQQRLEERRERERCAKIMDLHYFLEMVDLKHRYGSNLLEYHALWMKSSTRENFFYWLDCGEGKDLDLPICSRQRLEKEQVRYLSREERMHYLVAVDAEGKLCWKRNGVRIDTTVEWRDSIHGIVPMADTAPSYTPPAAEANHAHHPKPNMNSSASSTDTESDSRSHSDDTADERYDRYTNQESKKGKGPKKLMNVSPAIIFNHLLRKSVRKNTWIFVADTKCNLYVGIKQSGAFQHSSFLQGARISAAGLIKISHGQLKSLSPLSGHYRPPAANFRAFINDLTKRQGVDMSQVHISKTFAVLVGLEGYARTRKKVKEVGEGMKNGLHVGRRKIKDEERVERKAKCGSGARSVSGVRHDENEK